MYKIQRQPETQTGRRKGKQKKRVRREKSRQDMRRIKVRFGEGELKGDEGRGKGKGGKGGMQPCVLFILTLQRGGETEQKLRKEMQEEARRRVRTWERSERNENVRILSKSLILHYSRG